MRRPNQAERSEAMRERLTRAAIASLVEDGYARTTAVAVCARAGVTRGAFHHHFASLAALYAEALERLYADIVSGAEGGTASETKATSLEQVVQIAWRHTKRPEFKGIIEIWLASRNDETLREELAPRIEKLSELFSPVHDLRLAKRIGESPKAAAFYRLVMETMIGMALGRAVSPKGRAVAHEAEVVGLLTAIARSLPRSA